MFRCTRTFRGSGTLSGILRETDCGCGRAVHRSVHPQHGYGSRRVLIPNQLGLHERHRELRAQLRRQGCRRARPHWGHPHQLDAERRSLGEGTPGRYRDALVSPRPPDGSRNVGERSSLPPQYGTGTRTVALHTAQRTPATTSSYRRLLAVEAG